MHEVHCEVWGAGGGGGGGAWGPHLPRPQAPPPAHPVGPQAVPRPAERPSPSSGSSSGSPPGGSCPEHLSRDAFRRPLKQLAKPLQLVPPHVEEQRLYCELLPPIPEGDPAPHPVPGRRLRGVGASYQDYTYAYTHCLLAWHSLLGVGIGGLDHPVSSACGTAAAQYCLR